MAWWLWFLFGFALIGAEILTPGAFFLLLFGIAGVAVGVITSLEILVDPAGEWLLFSAISVLLLLTVRGWLVRKGTHLESKDDRDDLVGTNGTAELTIAPGATGRVSLRGTEWSAHNVGSQIINKGERVTVSAIKGLTLDVTKHGA